MITGYDTVLITGQPVDAGIRVLLDDLHDRWPHMLVAVGGEHVGPFLAWRTARTTLPADAGEVYVARDAQMERRWDDLGYALMEHDEGPFGILYEPARRPAVEVQLTGDPYGRAEGGFEPYPATLITAGLSLVTLVTPDADSPFSRRLLDALRQALTTPTPG